MDFFRPTHPLNLENSRFFFFFEPFPKIDKIAVWIAPKSETMIIFKIFGCRMRRELFCIWPKVCPNTNIDIDILIKLFNQNLKDDLNKKLFLEHVIFLHALAHLWSISCKYRVFNKEGEKVNTYYTPKNCIFGSMWRFISSRNY